MSARARRFRFWLVFLLAMALAGAAAAGVYRMRRVQAGGGLPVAPVRHGDFLVVVRCRGELTAAHSVQIVAPVVPNLRIVWTAPAGVPVNAGDAVVRFDPSSAQQQLAEKQAGLEPLLSNSRRTRRGRYLIRGRLAPPSCRGAEAG